MSAAESNKDTPQPESQLTDEMLAYHRLNDLGIRSGEGEASYQWTVAFVAMLDAVKVIRHHASQLPEDIQADLQLKFYKLCKDMESFTTLWNPLSREVAKRQLISEEEEQRRLLTQKNQTIENIRKKEELDVIVEAEQEPTNTNTTTAITSIPTREDLYNMCLSLQKQIKTLEDKQYALENNKNDTTNNRGSD